MEGKNPKAMERESAFQVKEKHPGKRDALD
jgi:hypothetical protein